jgi:hypothetical protein
MKECQCHLDMVKGLESSYLESIPSLGTLTARGLPGGDSEGLGRHAHGPLHFELLVLGTPDQLGADLFEALDILGGQGDTNAVDGGILDGTLLGVLKSRLKKSYYI